MIMNVLTKDPSAQFYIKMLKHFFQNILWYELFSKFFKNSNKTKMLLSLYKKKKKRKRNTLLRGGIQ